mgnify:CR=1 FL=1
MARPLIYPWEQVLYPQFQSLSLLFKTSREAHNARASLLGFLGRRGRIVESRVVRNDGEYILCIGAERWAKTPLPEMDPDCPEEVGVKEGESPSGGHTPSSARPSSQPGRMDGYGPGGLEREGGARRRRRRSRRPPGREDASR